MTVTDSDSEFEDQSKHSRRDFIKIASATTFAMAAQTFMLANAAPKPENSLSPEEALKRLEEGNKRYISGVMKRHDFTSDRNALAGGQNPFAGILSCADSRIAPEYAFDTGRGDLFVVRVAGNFLNDDAIASFEYAVKFLGTPLLVVLGHAKCGAVEATIKTVKDGAELPGHLPGLVARMKDAVKVAQKQPGDLLANAVRENVILTVKKLKTATPIINKLVEEKKVQVIGGIYELGDGAIVWLK